MKKLVYLGLLLVLAMVGWCFRKGIPSTGDAETRRSLQQTKSIVSAANAFLNTLTPNQRKAVQIDFLGPAIATKAVFKRNGGPGGPGDSKGGGVAGGQGGFPGFIGEQYGQALWSNYPVSDVPRPGIRLDSLTDMQRSAAMNLLKVLLSAKGYEKVQEIMGSDQALSDAGTNFVSGAGVYTLSIFGMPDENKPWMAEFGGHHLGLNVIVAGVKGALTPTLTGAQPAVYTVKGKTVRALAAENDKAFALIDALDQSQLKKAVLNYEIKDLVLGPGHDGETIVPEGLKGSEMTEKQKAMLLDVLSEWAGIINDVYVKDRMESLREGLDSTYFAWSGPTTHEPNKNGAAYYRIQGPKVIVEFSPQGTNGDLTMHVHTIYRDPTNEYGNNYSGK